MTQLPATQNPKTSTLCRVQEAKLFLNKQFLYVCMNHPEHVSIITRNSLALSQM